MSDPTPITTLQLSPGEASVPGGVVAALRARGIDPSRTTRVAREGGVVDVSVWPPPPPPSEFERSRARYVLFLEGREAAIDLVRLAVPASASGAIVVGAITGRWSGAAAGAALGLLFTAAIAWRNWPGDVSPGDPVGEAVLDGEGHVILRANTPELQLARAVAAFAPLRWDAKAWTTPAVGAAIGGGALLVALRSWWSGPAGAAVGVVTASVIGATRGG